MSGRSECDDFVLSAIHDLRAPLRTSTTMAQMLERSLQGKLEDKERNLLHLMYEANRLQRDLLSRLAEYCQAGDDLERFAPVDAGLLLEEAVRTVRARAGDSPLDIQIEGPSDLLAPHALQRAFVELLDNAVKYSRGAVEIRITSRRVGAECVLEFRDNGIGFEPEFSEVIMEPLKRLHSASSYPGFGLGLAIAQRIVNALGGRLWAESASGAGSTFHVSLPARG